GPQGGVGSLLSPPPVPHTVLALRARPAGGECHQSNHPHGHHRWRSGQSSTLGVSPTAGAGYRVSGDRQGQFYPGADVVSRAGAPLSHRSLVHTRQAPTELESHRWVDFSWFAGLCRLSTLWAVVKAGTLAGWSEHRSGQAAPLAPVSAPPGSPPGSILYVASVAVCRVTRAAFPGFCLWEHPNLSVVAPAARQPCPAARRSNHRGHSHRRSGPGVFLCAGQRGYL